MSANRFQRSAKVTDSGSWNQYSYTLGDPVSRKDLSGLVDCPSDDPCTKTDDPPMRNSFYGAPSGASAEGGPATTADSQRTAVFYAIGQAEERLFQTDCAGLFLAQDSNTPDARKALSDKLQSLEENNTIRLYPGTVPGHPDVAADTTETFGLIRLFGGGAFFTGKTSTGQSLGGAFQGMSLSTFQQEVIIHDFLHYMGIVGPDDNNQQYTLPNGDMVTCTDGISAEVRKKCF